MPFWQIQYFFQLISSFHWIIHDSVIHLVHAHNRGAAVYWLWCIPPTTTTTSFFCWECSKGQLVVDNTDTLKLLLTRQPRLQLLAMACAKAAELLSLDRISSHGAKPESHNIILEISLSGFQFCCWFNHFFEKWVCLVAYSAFFPLTQPQWMSPTWPCLVCLAYKCLLDIS